MYALVTGASSGIGLQYAIQLARDYKYDLVLVSNQEKELAEVGERLASEYGVRTVTYFCDLSKDDAASEVHEFCVKENIEVEVLINNAGVFFFQDLIKVDSRRVDLMVKLHILTLTKMCQIFAADMCERRHGRILNMSSMSAWMAMPGINIYNSSKAYILNFSRSLWYECKPYGVTVTAITPGAVDTGLYGLSDYWRRVAVAIRVSITPERLVKKSLKAMFKGRKQLMPGVLNHIFLPFIKHLPDWVVFTTMKYIRRFQK